MKRTWLVAALGAVAFVTSIDSAGAATYAVGHTVKRMEVVGTAPNELRVVDVHLWYPADAASAAARPLTVYRSALYGKPLAGTVGSAGVVADVQARARGRLGRVRRQAVPGDRVLARVGERPAE